MAVSAPLETLRWLQDAHAILGWLSVAALVVGAVLLRASKHGRAAALVACSIATLTGALGGYLYYFYSHLLRRGIYLASMTHGRTFERKEHLAIAAIALAWTGALAHTGNLERSSSRARFAQRAYVMAALLAAVVATMGWYVARFRSF